MAGPNLFNMLNYGPTNRGGLGLSLEEERKRKEEEARQAQIDQWLAAREAGGIEPHGNPSGNGFFSNLKEAFAPKTISEDEAERLKNSPVHIIEKTITPTIQDDRTSVNPHGNPNDGGMGIKEQFDPYGKSIGFTPTPGTVPKDPNATDAPAGEIVHGTHEGFTKQLDSSYIAAALQSSIPEGDQLFKPKEGRGGAYGGGPIPEMTQFLSAERRKKKNPSLWRYSNV
mgnify:CR=1 FL=1|tara:strand:+ start:1664 stop:2344 length:681 start_codon:yes stop_codon:yes gene_type:complete